jgi:hypothetical protein
MGRREDLVMNVYSGIGCESYQTNLIALLSVKTLKTPMNPRFDVFRKQNEYFIKWVGTVASLGDAEALIQTDSRPINSSEDDYIVVHTAYGVTEMFARSPRQRSYESHP